MKRAVTINTMKHQNSSKSVIQFWIKITDTHFSYNTIRIVTNKDTFSDILNGCEKKVYNCKKNHAPKKKYRTNRLWNIILCGWPCNLRLTRVRSIRLLLFEIDRVFVNDSLIFKLTDLFILYFFIQNVYANKNVIREKG